jgi:hypothetical protein
MYDANIIPDTYRTGNFDLAVWLRDEVVPSDNFDETRDYPRVLRLIVWKP